MATVDDVLSARTADKDTWTLAEAAIAEDHNLAGEPRGTFDFDIRTAARLDRRRGSGRRTHRRGAWARCVQIVGALDAARDLTVAHTSERVQFGRPLERFPGGTACAGHDVRRDRTARAATALAVAAATDHGFASAATDYAVTVAKVAVGRAVNQVTTIAHQLHGAIGVTVEHRLWLATMRARTWVGDYGTTGHYALRLGRMALAAEDPWDLVVSCPST